MDPLLHGSCIIVLRHLGKTEGEIGMQSNMLVFECFLCISDKSDNVYMAGAKKLLFTVSPILYLLMFIATCQGKFTHYS